MTATIFSLMSIAEAPRTNAPPEASEGVVDHASAFQSIFGAGALPPPKDVELTDGPAMPLPGGQFSPPMAAMTYAFAQINAPMADMVETADGPQILIPEIVVGPDDVGSPDTAKALSSRDTISGIAWPGGRSDDPLGAMILGRRGDPRVATPIAGHGGDLAQTQTGGLRGTALPLVPSGAQTSTTAPATLKGDVENTSDSVLLNASPRTADPSGIDQKSAKSLSHTPHLPLDQPAPAKGRPAGAEAFSAASEGTAGPARVEDIGPKTTHALRGQRDMAAPANGPVHKAAQMNTPVANMAAANPAAPEIAAAQEPEISTEHSLQRGGSAAVNAAPQAPGSPANSAPFAPGMVPGAFIGGIAAGAEANPDLVQDAAEAEFQQLGLPVNGRTSGDGISPAGVPAGASAKQIVDQLSAQIIEHGSHSSRKSVELRLDPPELGRVRLHFTGSDGNVAAMISVDRPDTEALLRRHIGLLESALLASGFGSVNLGFSSRNSGGEGHQTAPDSFAGARGTEGIDGPPSAPAPSTRRWITDRDLDIRM